MEGEEDSGKELGSSINVSSDQKEIIDYITQIDIRSYVSPWKTQHCNKFQVHRNISQSVWLTLEQLKVIFVGKQNSDKSSKEV